MHGCPHARATGLLPASSSQYDHAVVALSDKAANFLRGLAFGQFDGGFGWRCAGRGGASIEGAQGFAPPEVTFNRVWTRARRALAVKYL
ncbi:hypothetical protein L485_02810 [Sphingobium baderi LL03]|uniref:Uncharacterized protein n=1 Tax=Sphingobium baderi LL03 TaxID=1114964 RepID=T0GXG7_9SPHN|nr:hypothetical protein L485_02810 [Sphingobium baderi LL03]